MRLFQRGRFQFAATLLCGISILSGCDDKVVVTPAAPASKPSEPPPQHALALSGKQDFQKLVVELKSSDTPPSEKENCDAIASELDRDSPEIKRISNSIKILVEHIGEDWTFLLDHIDDQQNCVTLAICASRAPYFSNRSVGNICLIILRDTITYPAMVGVHDEVVSRHLSLNNFLIAKHPGNTDLRSWFRESKNVGKQFHELQLEYLYWAEAELREEKLQQRSNDTFTMDTIRQAIVLVEKNGKPIRIKQFNTEIQSIAGKHERF